MGFYRGPQIVKEGLVLYLDAANVKSYPGTGTTWKDLSGNENNFTLYNNPSYLDGYLNFDGTNSYARSSSTLDLSSYNSVTVEISFRVNTTISPNGMAFEHSSNWNSQVMGFGLVPNSTGATTYVSNSHHTNQRSGASVMNYSGIIGTDIVVHTNIWSRVEDITGRIAYINSVQRNFKATSNYSNFRNDFFYVSSRGGTTLFANHRVYFIRVYGKKLSPEEILQNYNATKGRYGL
jgi:hypothetical protein